jgi:tRNA 2-thiouridine synthesizing protein C
MKSVLVIIDKAPYGRENALGALYIAIACLDRCFSADVLLIDDGVYAALDCQNSEESLNYPNIGELMYSVFPQGKIFVHVDSLIQRGLDYNDLIEITELIEDKSLYDVIMSKSKVIKV